MVSELSVSVLFELLLRIFDLLVAHLIHFLLFVLFSDWEVILVFLNRRQVNLAEALLDLIILHEVLLGLDSEAADHALVRSHAHLESLFIFWLLRHPIEFFERSLDVILFDDFLKFGLELDVKFVAVVALFLGVAAVEDAYLLV